MFRETEPYGAGKVARYYLAATQEVAVTLAVSMELGRPKHDEYRWLHYGEARRSCLRGSSPSWIGRRGERVCDRPRRPERARSDRAAKGGLSSSSRSWNCAHAPGGTSCSLIPGPIGSLPLNRLRPY